MTSRTDPIPEPSEREGVSRRRFLTAVSTGVAGAAVAGSALADTLADVPARGPGALLGGHSERSPYVQISRIPEAGPGLRKVDPSSPPPTPPSSGDVHRTKAYRFNRRPETSGYFLCSPRVIDI
jgi:hypothetical protein